MSLFVKICGVTEPAVAEVAAASGADAIGLVFSRSVRRVSIRDASRIVAAVPSHVRRVAVFRKPGQSEVDAVISEVEVDVIQADHDSPIVVPGGIEFLPVLHDYDGMTQAGTPDRFVYEGRNSGSGEVADWDRARRLAVGRQLILAGGLDPANVAAAISEVSPHGVDVSSGVESSPGVKHPGLIARFVLEARQAAMVSEGAR